MSEAYGATIAKRGLARRLKELRVEAGYTANQVCDRLNWGRGKVGRFEANSWVRPELSDIRDLARIYEGSDLDELEELAARARRRAWWRDYSDVYDNEFPGFEETRRASGWSCRWCFPGCCRRCRTCRRSCRPVPGRLNGASAPCGHG